MILKTKNEKELEVEKKQGKGTTLIIRIKNLPSYAIYLDEQETKALKAAL